MTAIELLAKEFSKVYTLNKQLPKEIIKKLLDFFQSNRCLV